MTPENETEAPARPALYDRLGGVYNIAPVVDDFATYLHVRPARSLHTRDSPSHPPSCGRDREPGRHMNARMGAAMRAVGFERKQVRIKGKSVKG